MRNSRILLVKAKSEDSLLGELTKWCEGNLTAGMVDEALFEDGTGEEQKYFLRTDRIKQIISNKFMNLDEAFLEHFVDEYYQRFRQKAACSRKTCYPPPSPHCSGKDARGCSVQPPPHRLPFRHNGQAFEEST